MTYSDERITYSHTDADGKTTIVTGIIEHEYGEDFIRVTPDALDMLLTRCGYTKVEDDAAPSADTLR